MATPGGAGGGMAGSAGRGKGLGALQMTLFVLLATGTILAVTSRTRSKRRRRTMSYVVGPDGKHVDIGAIFGLDVGGTLSKLVYFEQTRKSRKVERVQQQKRRSSNYLDKDHPLKKTTLKRSQSLENLNTPRHTKALDAFYEFMQAEGSPVRAELRDDNLTVYSRVLGGELHFMRFETRYMDKVVDIVKSNRLHHSINTMGCTGGGAYKFSDLFQERLAITLRKMDELDCLMRGLEFVLQHVVGECYTYKPDKSLATVPVTSPTGSGLDRMPWRSSSGAAVSPTSPTSFSSAAQGEIPPLPKGKVSRVGVGASASSSSSATPHVAFAASVGGGGGGNSHTHIGSSSGAFDPNDKTDNNSPGLSLDGEEDGGLSEPEGSPRLRTSSAYSSTGMPSPPSNGAEAPEEPRRRAPSGGSGANAGTLKQEWRYKVQRSGEHVIYPYLVVNIGSGVSILKVEGPGKYERISGSSLGGGTYWGLCRLLTNCKSFDEVLDLAEIGDANLVDMTVGDIYGSGYDKFHLSPTVIASSFGKLATKQDAGDGLREEDMARALLMMITGNIGQVAYLNAVIHRATHIYFVGNFLRHNKISCRRLAYAIDYWSAGKMEALFLEHEGYFGAMGAFLSSYTGHEASTTAQTAGSGTAATGTASSSSKAKNKLRKQATYTCGDSGMGKKRVEVNRLEQSYAGFCSDSEAEDASATSPTDSVSDGGFSVRASPSPTPPPIVAATT